ncbi:MAG: DUF1552 domain-containing protein [Deltaproteobacteria bacterium]|nr:DUF1552 domain-containing protein [Nannocystaceae bacterium]
MNRRFSRRALLSSLGASAAFLPLLHATRSHGGVPEFPKRLVVIAWPNGVHGDDYAQPAYWPSGGEHDFVIDASNPHAPLLPLVEHRNDIILLGGIDYRNQIEKGGGGGHAALPFMFTGTGGAPIDGTISDGVPMSAGGPSVDQFIASGLQAQAQLPFHSLVLQPTRQDGLDRYLSFSGPPIGGQPNAPQPEYDPVALFDTLFAGGVTEPAALAKLRAERRSVLDHVYGDLMRMQPRLGSEDRSKLDGHMNAIRELEQQLEASGSCQVPSAPPRGDYETYIANPNLPEIMALQMDMLTIALACDMTRVGSMLWTNSTNLNVTFFWLGDEFTDPGEPQENAGFDGPYRHHHEISHNDEVDEQHTRMKNQVDQWFVSQLAYLLTKMKSIPEGDGTMLDNSVVVFANCQRTGGGHHIEDVPWILAGGCGGYFETGRLLRWAGGTAGQGVPQNGVLVALCNAMGMPVETFGDPEYGGELTRLRG